MLREDKRCGWTKSQVEVKDVSDRWNRSGAPSVVIVRCFKSDKHMSMTEDDGGALSRMMVKLSSCQGCERILDRVELPFCNSLDLARTLRGTRPTWLNWS